MKFCNNCDNIFYISNDEKDNNILNYYCRHCNNEENHITNDNICVLNTNFKKNEDSYNFIVNEYTKYDPTLPHIFNIPCPNNNCKSNTDSNAKSDIIYIRYDNAKMKYIYLCNFCDYTWKTNE